MAELNWNLLQVPDIAQNALAAFDQGRQRKQQDEARNAFATYAANPNEASLNALAPHNPQFVMQQRATLQKQQQDAQAQHREQLVLISRLLDHAKDEPTYQQALAAARQGGIDLAEVPQTFDPNWVSQTRMLVTAMQDPKAPEILSTYGKIAADRGLQPGSPEFTAFVTQAWQADQVKTIPYTQGGGVAGYNPATGVTNTIVAPNPGGYAAGTPVGGGSQGGPQPGAVINGHRFKGGNPNDRNSWEVVGGSGGNVGGGFRP